jgi:hypothetical protein
MSREKHAPGQRDSKDWGNQPLRFASDKLLMKLTGGHCPCHPDKKPSFSAKKGREPGTTIVACGARCSQDELLAHFRKLGYRLGPMKMGDRQRRSPKCSSAMTATRSVAFVVLTPSEQRMYHLIAAGQSPTYDEFEAAGVRRKSISGGLRVLQELDLMGVKRSPRRKGCKQYEPNEYWVEEENWLRWEPPGSGSSKEAMKRALKRARAVARAARKGGGDIDDQAGKPETGDVDLRVSEVAFATIDGVGKTEVEKQAPNSCLVSSQGVSERMASAVLRFSEVAFRGGVSPPESYVVRTLASTSQDSLRHAPLMKGEDGGVASADEAAAPPPPSSDPGPSSEDDYGADPDMTASLPAGDRGCPTTAQCCKTPTTIDISGRMVGLLLKPFRHA